MKLQSMIAATDSGIRVKAEELLRTVNFICLRPYGWDGYEALILYENGILMPAVTLGQDETVHKHVCQCRDGKNVCVHVAAVLIGIDKQLRPNRPDIDLIEETHLRR